MRIILFGMSFVALLLLAAIVGPSFVDWNKYKAQIVAQVEKTTGLNVQINGDLSLAVLPSPRVKIEDMVVVAPKKIKFENLLKMESAEVSVALMPLLQKKVQVSSVTLISPDIQIEILEDGTPSWTTDKMAKAKQVSDVTPSDLKTSANTQASKALESIALDKLTIENGKLAFINHATGQAYSAQEVNVELEADSLKGPFTFEGSAVYDAKKIAINAETGKLPAANEALKVSANVTLPDADAEVTFNGLANISEPFEVQGQTKINVSSPAKLAKLFGSNSDLNQSLKLEGLLTANQKSVKYNDLKLAIGDFVGAGALSFENAGEVNPSVIKANIKSNSVLDLDSLMPKTKSAPKAASTQVGTASDRSSSIVPQILTLPMQLNANIQLDVGGVKLNGQQIKGVFVDVNKTGATTSAKFKVLELPGQAKAEGQVKAAYMSSSISPKTKAVTYSDPSVSYSVDGQVDQLANFLKAFAPDADTSAVTKLYKTAQFNLNGGLSANAISLQNSTMKLDDMVVGLGGRYVPATAGKRAKATIDLSAGSVDFDKIMAAQGKKTAANNNQKVAAKSPKEAMKPLQDFNLPLDVDFDVSLQKARINQSDLNGLRLKGSVIGEKVTLENASINDFAGAALSLKGVIGNLSDLTGLDLNFYTKTSDIKKLARALKVDTSKLPPELNALEANIGAKGSVDSLGFDAKLKSMGGQLDVAGNAANLLGTPSYNNLSVGLNHPNLVKAIQVVSPSFKGQVGLNQPINLRTQASIDGKKIDLTNLKVKLGQTSFGGNLNINASGSVASVRGNIQAGEIALDDLLGAKTSSKSSGGSGSSSAAASSGRWSKAPIDLSFMNTTDIDVSLAATSLTYGAWNFAKPSTNLRIGNGQMIVKDMKAGVFGGQASLSTEVKASPLSLTLSSNMDGIDLEKLVKSLSGSSKLKTSGAVSFDLNVASNGASAHALINALNGKANLNGTNITLKGFDLVKLARGLATEEKLAVSALSLVDGAMNGGQTKFDTLKGDYKITNGVVNIQSMALDSAEANISSTGNADLPKWFINVDNVITLKKVTDLEPFEVKIKGPIDNPTDTFGKNILEDYITDKFKRKLNKELGDKLPDILGNDVTDKLKKFGILPQDKAPVAPKAAPTETTPTTPEPTPVAPKKIEKPADAVNEILNSSSPEEAVGNVLKGLF